jgi:hypothetical protein
VFHITHWKAGAKSYEPFLHVERAEVARLCGDEAAHERELREAHRLFTEIGAPIRAAEVASEPGSSGSRDPNLEQPGAGLWVPARCGT